MGDSGGNGLVGGLLGLVKNFIDKNLWLFIILGIIILIIFIKNIYDTKKDYEIDQINRDLKKSAMNYDVFAPPPEKNYTRTSTSWGRRK